jgi:ribonuclease P protein component
MTYRKQFMTKPDLRLTKQMHLRRPQDFERVYNAGVRGGDGHLLVFAMRNELASSRIGLSVSKKHGGAVQRNLKRRRLRETFRLLQHELPAGLDLILIPRQREDSTLQDFQSSLPSLINRLLRQLSGTVRSQPTENLT